MTMIEAMAARRSTRTFNGEKMTGTGAAELSAMLAALSGKEGAESADGKAEAASGRPPFGHEVRLAFHESDEGGKARKDGHLWAHFRRVDLHRAGGHSRPWGYGGCRLLA